MKDQFNESKVTPAKVSTILLNEIHPFFGGKGRTCKAMFTHDNKIKKTKNLLINQKFYNIKWCSKNKTWNRWIFILVTLTVFLKGWKVPIKKK